MNTRPLLSAACAVLVAAAPSFAQWYPARHSIYRTGSDMIVRPPAFALGYGAFNPNYPTTAFLPGVGNAYYPNYTGLRPSYWSLPGRYNAYPWSGAGVFTGGTAVYAYYWPWFYNGSSIDVGFASPYGPYMSGSGPYDAGYGPYGEMGYGGFDGGSMVYQASAPVGGYRAVVPAGVGVPTAPADRAVLAVQVPADATVWVQGAATKQTGTERTFVSPPLKPGQDYAYTIKAQWKAGDKTVEQSQDVTVRAGERSGLLFLAGDVAKAPPGR
jgi:uncharacterized protein (TIGR03000 family)